MLTLTSAEDMTSLSLLWFCQMGAGHWTKPALTHLPWFRIHKDSIRRFGPEGATKGSSSGPDWSVCGSITKASGPGHWRPRDYLCRGSKSPAFYSYFKYFGVVPGRVRQLTTAQLPFVRRTNLVSHPTCWCWKKINRDLMLLFVVLELRFFSNRVHSSNLQHSQRGSPCCLGLLALLPKEDWKLWMVSWRICLSRPWWQPTTIIINQLSQDGVWLSVSHTGIHHTLSPLAIWNLLKMILAKSPGSQC